MPSTTTAMASPSTMTTTTASPTTFGLGGSYSHANYYKSLAQQRQCYDFLHFHSFEKYIVHYHAAIGLSMSNA